jgi:aldose 1-epimerase
MYPATGQQFSLSLHTQHGLLTAVVTEVGACLRSFRLGAKDLVQSYPEAWMTPKRAGLVLSPWSNRVDGGLWQHNGQAFQLAINEVAKNNASHGLLISTAYRVIAQTPSSIRLTATVYPTAGYPFLVTTEVEYSLREQGLLVLHTAMNRSEHPAPYGVGVHPYFKLGERPLNELTLKSNAATVLVTNERQIPTGKQAVAGTEFDLSGGRPVGTPSLDHDFTDLERDRWGMAHSYLLDEAGEGLDIWQDESFKHVQYYTPSDFPTETGSVTALAVEPCTAGPNAFNTKDDLMLIEPNKVWTGRWGVDLITNIK